MILRLKLLGAALLVMALPLLGGCTTGAGGGTRGNPDLITWEQIEGASAANGYDLVRQLRPQWLRGRGSASLQSGEVLLPVVYIAEIRHGDVESLRAFDVDVLQELRFISATAATTRYGSGHAGGVIRVTLRSR